MPTATSSLLLKFRSRDTQFGVTRKTVKAMAERFDLSVKQYAKLAEIGLGVRTAFFPTEPMTSG